MNLQLSLLERLHIRWARAIRWEFWPAWLFYIPVVLWILLLGLRFRHFTAFTAANPGMDEGGVVGERKSAMLLPLQERAAQYTPQTLLVPMSAGAEQGQQHILQFIAGDYPVVLKPDVGQRGRGVAVARNEDEALRYLAQCDFDLLVQTFCAGEEYGVFVYREPQSAEIQIFSITGKDFPAVKGDGRRNIAELIRQHPRAWLIAPLLFQRHAARLQEVLPADEELSLVELGSHCRGATFLDACHLSSEELRQSFQHICDQLPDFHFGRFDVICPDAESLQAGREIKVLEVNGVTAEAAHIYQPGYALWRGYAVFFRQWYWAFKIGQHNRQHGALTVSPLRLLSLWLNDRAAFDQAEKTAATTRR